jgi:hypothetical protein
VTGYNYEIVVLGDRLSEEMLKFFKQFPVTILNEELGNDKSIRRSIELASIQNDDVWVYMCEDDYLHHPDAFLWMTDLIENRQQYILQRPKFRLRKGANRLSTKPIIIHPPDYPDRYLRKYMKYSLIFVAKYCHWRQVTSTTFTILATAGTFKRYLNTFIASSRGARDQYLIKNIFGGRWFGRKALCLSPIPGVATHMREDVMTPLVDWGGIYIKILADLEGQK